MSRLSAAVALELRVELRYRIPLVALAMTVVWCLVLLAMPTWLARGAGPFVLIVDTATFGAFFIAALFLFERGEGALAALSVSPLRFRAYLGVRVAVLTGLSVASAVPIALVAGRGQVNLGLIVVAVALLSALFLLLNFALVVRHRSLTGFLTVAPLPLAPLIAVPLAHLAGLVEHPWCYVVPTTGAAALIRTAMDSTAGVSPAGIVAAIAYLLVAVVAAGLAAKWSYIREFTQPGRAHVRRDRRVRVLRHPRGWVSALAQIDARTTARSSLLLVVLAGPMLLAVAIRLGYPPMTRYLYDELGLDLARYQPILLAALVVLHVPLIIGMVGALLFLDDVDDRKLLVLRVSPVTLPRYMVFRSVSVAVLALMMLLLTVPISGLAAWRPSMLPALVLAAAQAPLITLATAAFAGNKVEGVAVLKILGVIPTGIAPAMWWLPSPADWPLMLIPPYWAVDVLWRPNIVGMLIGTLLTVLVTALLARRTLNRLG
ncbi:hypothetical protein MOQ72_25845 [Saccharopolyspora sp. K220]|uniref:fluoroquinolone export ABC transporter permease subunit n=1 Tax=Saccharopolyspora soli TaxID=2926618 RepID=UPI001F5A84CA|nr:hypothetical protein [Saccharopolyspora soli]MCI2420877.1 hypothetical protein [Saccharopolyspora soli]